MANIIRDYGGSVLLCAVLALPFGATACSHFGDGAKTAMQSSPRVPAAEGAVSVKDGDNGNVKLAVSVKHMAPPEKVAVGASSYVVWLRPLASGASGTEAPQNLGALAVNKDLEGKLDTVTSYRQFDLFVTAESEAGSAAPTGEQLLTTTIRR